MTDEQPTTADFDRIARAIDDWTKAHLELAQRMTQLAASLEQLAQQMHANEPPQVHIDPVPGPSPIAISPAEAMRLHGERAWRE